MWLPLTFQYPTVLLRDAQRNGQLFGAALRQLAFQRVRERALLIAAIAKADFPQVAAFGDRYAAACAGEPVSGQ